MEPRTSTPPTLPAAPVVARTAAAGSLATVGKGAATLGALVLPWLIITKAANNGGEGGNGGTGGTGGRGGGGGRGKGGKGGRGDEGRPRGGLVMRMLVLASCAVVGYVARDRLQRMVAQVVALVAAMWAGLEQEEDVEDRVQMALAFVQ